MTLIASYGGNGSNSYIDATQATSFIKSATLSFDAWTSLSGAQKQAALQMATRDIESFTYSGFRYFSDQTLQFPPVPESFPVQQDDKLDARPGHNPGPNAERRGAGHSPPGEQDRQRRRE